MEKKGTFNSAKKIATDKVTQLESNVSNTHSTWLNKEQMINHIFRELNTRPTRIDIKRDSVFSTGKPRYIASFYGTGSSDPLFVCMASRREVQQNPSKYKVRYYPHDSRNMNVEEKLIDELTE